MATRKRPAAVLDADHGHAADQHQQSPTCCKRSRASIGIGSTDDYEKVACLGKGGFGVVLRMRHRATKKNVAVKFLSSPAVEDLEREARFLEACNGNPYVVGFEGLVCDPATGNTAGLVMEYVEASSLQSLLRDRRGDPPLPESMVRDFMWKLLTGAEEMHEHDRHIVHRDIKPANILVGRNGELVKICDLALAMSMADWPPYNRAGTASYMAPEMILGKRDYDALVDTWSIGCVFAELLTGTALFMVDPEDDEEEDETKNDVGQLGSIFRVLGVTDERTWPGFTSLPLTVKAPQLLLQAGHKHRRLRDLFPEEKLSEEGFQLLQGLLTCNSDERLTAAAALKHPWFAAPRSAAAKVDALSFQKKKTPRIKFMPPAMPEKNLLKIPLAVWNAAQRV